MKAWAVCRADNGAVVSEADTWLEGMGVQNFLQRHYHTPLFIRLTDERDVVVIDLRDSVSS